MSAFRTVALTRGKVAIVDEDDYPRVSAIKWSARRSGRRWYAIGNVRDGLGGGRSVLMHRLILDVPLGVEVDHSNGDGLDNRRANLRRCSRRENMRNQRRSPIGKLSRYKGVSRNTRTGKWIAYIRDGRPSRLIHLGSFVDETEAARAYDTEAAKRFGQFASLNLPRR